MDQFMEAALSEARTGAAESGIPIGAALVDGQGRLVAAGRNRRVQDRAVVMHAEINCLFNAGKTVSDFRGNDHLLNTHAVSYVRWSGRPVRHHQGGRGRVGEFPGRKRPGSNGSARVDVVDLDQDEAKELLREFILRNPDEWSRDIGR